MRSLKHLSLLSMLSIAFLACGTPAPTDASTNGPDSAHSSQNSLDWSGTYSGIVPSASGEEVRTTITLNSDGTYKKQLEYIGKPDGDIAEAGAFNWQAEGSQIALQNANGDNPNYLVGENQLIQLDLNGERMTGELADQYALQRVEAIRGMPLIDTYWKLVEITGQPIAAMEGRLPAHIVISNEEKRASGNSGCNSFFSTYELDEQASTIRFQQAGSTMMACLDMRTEEDFHKNLLLVDQYVIAGTTLTFSKAGEGMLLRFEAVEM